MEADHEDETLQALREIFDLVQKIKGPEPVEAKVYTMEDLVRMREELWAKR